MQDPESFPSNIFFDGNELNAEVRQFDWSATPLGSVDQWSINLCTAVNESLASSSQLLDLDSNALKISPVLTHLEKELQHRLAQAPVAICIFRGPTFIIVAANDWMLKLWGKTAAQVMFKPVFEAVPESIGQGYEELLQQVYTEERRFSINEMPATTLRNRRIETVYLNLAYEPFRQENDPLVNITVVATEVTQSVAARHKIEESEQQKMGILNSIRSHIAVLNTKGEIIMVNDAWTQFAIENGGTALQGMGVGENYLEILQRAEGENAEEAPVVSEGVLAVLNGELPIYSMDYPCHSPTQQRWFILEVSPLTSTGKGVIVSHTNITDRRLSELAFRDNEQRLRSLSNTLEQKVQEHARALAEMAERLR